MDSDAPSGGAGGAAAPPDFGRSEGTAGQRRRAALLPAPRIFDPWCIPGLLSETKAKFSQPAGGRLQFVSRILQTLTMEQVL